MAVYTASQTLNYLSERSGLYTVVTEGPDGLGEEGRLPAAHTFSES
jgi:hypothetical protein